MKYGIFNFTYLNFVALGWVLNISISEAENNLD